VQNGGHHLGLVRAVYRVRTGAFAWCLATVSVWLWERDAPPIAWTLMALQFLVYPHLMYLRSKFSAHPTRAELDNLFLDSALLGAVCAGLGFPTWITFMMLGATLLNAVVNRGLRGFAWSLACAAAGAALCVGVLGLHYEPATSQLVTALCVAGSAGYAIAVGQVVYGQNRRLAAARDELASSEERYRMIAENAGDLIALVDTDGRWLYASPSHKHVLPIEPGGDALQRVHPDDADAFRAAVKSGATRNVALRLVDNAGRVRQYKTRIQPLERGRVLLVSQDVTDLRESEERLLLAAHAFEGMTEAILITAADGTIVTVNRAFCELTGLPRDDVLGRNEREVRNALQPPQFYDEVFAAVAREGYWSGTTWARRKNGSVYREWRSLRAVRDSGGAVTHYVMVFYEVGAQKAKDAAAKQG
jgi:PAS domain S-box-containing protein